LSHASLKEKALEIAAHLIVFAAIYGLLLSYFPPSYVLLKTITTGGDTPSHYAAADYLIHTLLPRGRIIGWMQGNYAGFPLFQYYFPLPFLIMALLQAFMPLQIAFKLVTVLGTFLLPLCTYGCLKLLDQQPPIRLIGAAFSLAFLFMESNSMWGGNIPSTLAGEFAYSLGFALFVLYVGSYYRGIRENRLILLNAFIVTGIGLSHGYTLIFAVLAPSFFLFTTQGFFRNLGYYLKVNALAFFLLGFWLIQLLWFSPYTTPFNFIWVLDGLSQVFPMILLPMIVLALIGTVLIVREAIYRKEVRQKEGYVFSYLWFIILMAGAFYYIAYEINLVDIRFLPCIQFLLTIIGALGVGVLSQWMRARHLVAILLACLVVLWVDLQVTYIPSWIKWDYSGMETKGLWPQFRAVNRYLKGSCRDPRVVYEHGLSHRAAGSVRALESLPLFSGRSTLEGLYIQSSITSPFIFYLQSETSPTPSCPLSTYNYSKVNFKRGLEHLKMFNVSHFLAVTDEIRRAIEKCPGVIRKQDIPPYTVYRLEGNSGKYISLLDYEPPLIITDNWRRIAFEWFRKGNLATHLVFKDTVGSDEDSLFSTVINSQITEGGMPKEIQAATQTDPDKERGGSIRESIGPEEIIFETPHIGRPHLVRISFHPNWHVEGAERIYLASPSFMLVYPTRERVRLYFGRSLPNYLGYLLSAIGIVIVLAGMRPLRNSGIIRYSLFVIRKTHYAISQSSFAGRLKRFPYKRQVLWGVSLAIIGTCTLTILLVHHNEPTHLYNRGMGYFKKGDYEKARTCFEKGMKSFPLSPIIDQTAFHFALTYFKEEEWDNTLESLEKMAGDYPESRKLPEVLYHIGLCHLKLERQEEAIKVFQALTEEFPEEKWSEYAKERLQELGF
jgi:tetratricopeptide (TPR) repeat protein